MANSKLIFLVGYYGFGNIGDEAILSATLVHFRGRRADLHFVVASGNPEQTAASHGTAAIRWNDTAAILRTVQAADLVVIGGGGLFQDYWGVDADTFLTDRHWGVVYYAGPALLAMLYRKPLILFAVGVGPLYSEHGKKFTRVAAEAASAITVRDEASQTLLEELGIPKKKIRVTADPAFLFQPAAGFTLAEALPADFVIRRPVLAVAARHWGIGVYPEFLEREIAAALDVFLKDTDGTVVLLPFQDISGEKEDDRATALRILSHMRLAERAAIAPAGSVDQVYGWLGDSDVVLGMRLHALIFAALAGVPAVALSYDPKVDELARMLRLENLTLDVKNVDAAVLVRHIADALERGRELGKGMQLAAAALRQEAAANISAAIGLLDVLPGETGPCLERFIHSEVQEPAQEMSRAVRELAGFAERCQALENENRAIAEKLAGAGRQNRALQEAEQALRAEIADTRAKLHLASESADRLSRADAERASALREWDRYGTTWQANLAVYRSQRAWRAMLLLRKGYTLLHASKLEFLRWGVGLLLGRAGNLDEYELSFPDLANYVPETFRHSWIAGEPAGGSPPAAEPAMPAAVPDTPPQPNRYDVVILAIIDFDFRFQRPQQIAVEYARQGHRVFWISPTRFLPSSSPQAYESVQLRDNLWEIHLRCRQPDIYMGELKADDVEAMAAALQPFYRDWTVAEHSVMVQLPFWRRLALRLRALYGSTLLYDCMDDWETFENMGAFNVREEKLLVGECDVLIVTGAELERKFRAQGLHPVLARNGADYAFFAAAGPNDLLTGVPRPIVGYFGAIADWIDLDLVYAVAKARPQYSFVLIGQVFGRDVSALEALPNVRLLGNKPYADIPAYLHHFDACLIPFLLNQVTKATDPVKLYEYLSQGKPVVATDMAELSQCGDLLYIGRDAEDFARKVDLAVAERDEDLVRRRIGFAQANTWTSRVQQIDETTRKAFPLVSILVVTYNSGVFVRPCLESILRNTSYPSYEVVMVDNASADHTAELLREYAARDGRLRLYGLAENLGFAGGNNYAARQARGEHLIFLNIDTMVTAGWVGRLLRYVHRDPSIGLLCPVTNFAGNEVKINVSYSGWREMERFARALAAGKDGRKLEIQVAPLYCALMPRAVWDRVGEMDTRYEIGMFEDDDLSLRVRQAGYGVFAAEDCFIHHFGQGSFSQLPGDTYNRIFEANRKRFEEKWKRPWTAHRTRPGVRPAFEEKRFEPAEFVGS